MPAPDEAGLAHRGGKATTASSITTDGAVAVAWRLAVAIGGGYLIVSGLIAVLGSTLPYLGLARGEAVSLAVMLGLLAFPGICIFAVATRHPWRNGLLLLTLGVSLIAAAIFI